MVYINVMQENSMTLKEYLTEHKISYAAFSRKLKDYGVEATPEAVGYWAKGERLPMGKETYQAISSLTDKMVTPNVFFEVQ